MPSLADFLQPANAPAVTALAKQFQQQSPQAPHFASVQARMASPEAGQDRDLRDAEHALFAQSLVNDFGRLGAAPILATAVPGYTGAKWAAQNAPKMSGIPAGLEALLQMPLTKESGATPPDLREIYWGLRPLLGSLGQ